MGNLRTPLILVNMKTYIEGTGEKVLDLAKEAEKIREKVGTCIGLAPQYTYITSLAKKVSLPIFAQHVDPITPGRFTGHILPEAIKQAGAIGTLINHSERRMKLDEIDTVIKRMQELELVSIVCANNSTVSASVAALNPNFIAIEPPELIGTGIPVSKAKPEVITETVRTINRLNPAVTILCGAGITQGEDVSQALKLGTKGVLVASGVVRAKKPSQVLLEFAIAASDHC